MYQETKSQSQLESAAKKSIIEDLGLNNFNYPNAVPVSTESLKLIIKPEYSLKPKCM